jgi:hypothetical protein
MKMSAEDVMELNLCCSHKDSGNPYDEPNQDDGNDAVCEDDTVGAASSTLKLNDGLRKKGEEIGNHKEKVNGFGGDSTMSEDNVVEGSYITSPN